MVQQNQKQNKRRHLLGTVVSDKMAKTVVVTVERIRILPKYRKRVRVTKRFKADIGAGRYLVGDRVQIEECRPLSRDKRWRVISKI